MSKKFKMTIQNSKRISLPHLNPPPPRGRGRIGENLHLYPPLRKRRGLPPLNILPLPVGGGG